MIMVKSHSSGGFMGQPTYTERDDEHIMPWHFRAGDEEIGKDCILVATMLGGEMQAVSLHVSNPADLGI